MRIDRKRKVHVRAKPLDQMPMAVQELVHQYTIEVQRENRQLREAANRWRGVAKKVDKLEQLYRALLQDAATGAIPMHHDQRYDWVAERIRWLETIIDGGDKPPAGQHRNDRYLQELRRALGQDTRNPFRGFIDGARYTATGRRRG